MRYAAVSTLNNAEEEMNDLEITKLCAEAMELKDARFSSADRIISDLGINVYNPLHDDAQAMALVKKFGVTIERFHETWHVWPQDADFTVISESLNSAVCECVVKMQAAKK